MIYRIYLIYTLFWWVFVFSKMFIEPFVTLEKKNQNEEFIQDVITRLDTRNMNGRVYSWIVGYGGVVLTTVVENRSIVDDDVFIFWSYAFE